jgi:hypothetical protein
MRIPEHENQPATTGPALTGARAGLASGKRSHEAAQRIADRVIEAWYGQHVSGAAPAALGVVAALAMHGAAAPDEATRWWKNAGNEDITVALRVIWTEFQVLRPDLARLAGPLAEWLYQRPVREDWARAAGAAARAAASAGLLRMRRWALDDTDVLGAVYLNMQTGKDRQARGEYYTAPEVCELLAELQTRDRPLHPGMLLADPCAGTGGMFRGMAAVIRCRGLDPARFGWIGNDISPVSAAGLSVNSFLWRLGPSVLYGIADTLTEPGWEQRATREVRAAYARRDASVRDVRTLARIRGGFEHGTDPGPGPLTWAAPLRPDIVLDGSPAAQMALFGNDLPLAPGSPAPRETRRRGRGAVGTSRKRRPARLPSADEPQDPRARHPPECSGQQEETGRIQWTTAAAARRAQPPQQVMLSGIQTGRESALSARPRGTPPVSPSESTVTWNFPSRNWPR